jgi:serine/threonine protein phosphatase PrpC
MGATLTAVVLTGADAWIVEVGDSRAYLWRSGHFRQLTRDQSLVQVLFDSGALTAEEAITSPQKNIILQAMGLATTVHAAISRLSLRRGDRLLLCCDGLSNSILDDELSSTISQHHPADACNQLIDLANERGGIDKLTAIVATFDGEGLAPPVRNESVTSTIQVVQEFGPKGAASTSTPQTNPAHATMALDTASVTSPPRGKVASVPWLWIAIAVCVVDIIGAVLRH